MNTDILLQVTSFLIVFLSILFAFFLLTVKSKNRIGNGFLAIYLLIRAMDVSAYFYYGKVDLPLEIEMLRMDIGSFLKMPFLYFFVVSILHKNFKLKKTDLWHLLPFLVISILQLPVFYIANNSIQSHFIETYLYNNVGVFSISLAHLQYFFYLMLIFNRLLIYKKIRLDNYAISDDYNYRWVLQMNVFLSALFIVAIIKNLHKYVDFMGDLTVMRLSVAVGMLFFTCWLVLKALYAPKIFLGIDSELKLLDSNKSTEKNDPKINELAANIKRHLQENKPFLDAEFTIQNLSDQINTDVKEISLVLNHHLNQNFYEFINCYRIEEAKALLLKNKKLTVLEVLYQVGFNSKSSFNTQFKKLTGFTPTEYRKQNGK